MPPRARLHGHRSRRAGIEAETLYFVPLGETLEIWRPPRITNERRAARRSRCSAPSSSACGTPRTTRPTSSATLDRRGRGRRRRDLPQDRVPRAPRPLRLLRLLEPSSPASTRSARRSSARTAAGTAARRRARASPELDRPRLGADRLAPRRARARARRDREIVFVLGYAENPQDEKFDPPGSRRSTSGARKP